MRKAISEMENTFLRADVPAFAVGDTVRVQVEIIEGDKTRTQAFEGVVIARKGGAARATFTIRRIASGVGVERTFPLHSPRVAGIEVVRRGKVKRAKLYYLREKLGKKGRIKEGRLRRPEEEEATPGADENKDAED